MPPSISIAVADCVADTSAGKWRVTWLVANDGSTAVSLREAWIPHGRFRGEARATLNTELEPGTSTRLTFRVATAEAPGTLVENAFLILRCAAEGREWRVFTRMRIEFSAEATPTPVIEAVTAQSVE